ncbi:MAG: hypothetical protein WAV09_03240 [Minisyncoccia bacterium]
MPKIHLLKFESKTCPACQALNRRGTVTDLVKEFPDAELTTLVIADENGESPEGSAFEEAYNLSDVLEVQALPTIVICDERGLELGRIDQIETITKMRKVIEGAIEYASKSQATIDQILRFKVQHPA